jgi:hypothetical protein
MRWEREKRQGYYADVKKIRGEKELQALVDEVKRQWAMRSHSPAGSGSATQPGLF